MYHNFLTYNKKLITLELISHADSFGLWIFDGPKLLNNFLSVRGRDKVKIVYILFSWHKFDEFLLFFYL